MKQIFHYKLKACLKRYVFTWHLKFDMYMIVYNHMYTVCKGKWADHGT